MRAVVQRVKYASVTVDGEIVGKIDGGFLVLLGIKDGDTEKELDWMSSKISGLRVFEDENGKMNKELKDIGGSILVVSQFTLYGDCIKGKRPSFSLAARPDWAIPLYERFKSNIEKSGIPLQSGIFGADMKVELLNDGPVTLIIDTKDCVGMNG
ncbi:MAG: D-aminoacyl-tRNA deacylase [Fusobacteriaceae bacterium]